LLFALSLQIKSLIEASELRTVQQVEPTSFSWQERAFDQHHDSINIQELIIAPIECTLTFISKPKRIKNNKSFLKSLAVPFGLTLANFEGLKFKLVGIQLKSVFDDKQELQKKLLSHYK